MKADADREARAWYRNRRAEGPAITRLSVEVAGRPAPQGSKRTGEHGQMREASPYLPAWRQAVKAAVYARYAALGVEPATLPLFRGAVGVEVHFVLPPGRRADGPPDGDKLTRAVWDALTAARVWEDDGRAVRWGGSKKLAYPGESTGCRIEVWEILGVNNES